MAHSTHGSRVTYTSHPEHSGCPPLLLSHAVATTRPVTGSTTAAPDGTIPIRAPRRAAVTAAAMAEVSPAASVSLLAPPPPPRDTHGHSPAVTAVAVSGPRVGVRPGRRTRNGGPRPWGDTP